MLKIPLDIPYYWRREIIRASSAGKSKLQSRRMTRKQSWLLTPHTAPFLCHCSQSAPHTIPHCSIKKPIKGIFVRGGFPYDYLKRTKRNSHIIYLQVFLAGGTMSFTCCSHWIDTGSIQGAKQALRTTTISTIDSYL